MLRWRTSAVLVARNRGFDGSLAETPRPQRRLACRLSLAMVGIAVMSAAISSLGSARCFGNLDVLLTSLPAVGSASLRRSAVASLGRSEPFYTQRLRCHAAARRCLPGEGDAFSEVPVQDVDAADEAALDVEDGEAAEEEEKDEVLYFGGVVERQERKPEGTEAMRVASRINEALAMRRLPKPPSPGPLAIVETAWYDELGVSPRATQEELRLKYLQHASDVEQRLAYLLEAPADEEDVAPSNDDDDYADGPPVDEDADDVERLGGDKKGAPIMRAPEASLASTEDAAEAEANEVALQFTRISNLYQILSVPQLRRIYDEGGIEALAQRVPQLHKGLLEPETVLKMVQGKKFSRKPKVSLLLRKEPRTQTFARYQAANSIRQVLRRLTDVFRVWYFKTPASLSMREGSIYTELPEVAVFGRVNSGKSALLQHFLAAGKMRAKSLASVAQWPGKTKGIDVFAVNRRFTLADTPGYSYAPDKANQHASTVEVADAWEEKHKPLVEEYLAATPWLRAAIYAHDIAKDVTDADRDMVSMLRKRGIPVLLVLTKDDKVDSDTHRLSRARRIRYDLQWPKKWPHAYYCTRRGGYGRVFKNMFGTMLFGLLATETRQDALQALKTELPEIFFDYRDKYVPRPRGVLGLGKFKKPTKIRTYPYEDKPYTDEELQAEERREEKREKRKRREEKMARGEKWTLRDSMEEETGASLSPRDRRKRWEELLADASGR